MVQRGTMYLVLEVMVLLRFTCAFDTLTYPTYISHSLPELCAGNKSPVNLTSSGNHSALMLMLGVESTAEQTVEGSPSPLCHLDLQAPERHMLAVAYLRGDVMSDKEDTSCPNITLSFRNVAVGARKNLCERQGVSTTPQLYPRSLQLIVEGDLWPITSHRLMVTTVGTSTELCSSGVRFPCNWEQKNVPNTGHLIPNLCVSRHLACDSVINCPLSGADETPALCSTNQDSVHPKLPTKTQNREVSLLTKRIQEAAEKAAANLAIYGTHSVTSFIVSTPSSVTESERVGSQSSNSINMKLMLYVSVGLLAIISFFLFFTFCLLRHQLFSKYVSNCCCSETEVVRQTSTTGNEEANQSVPLQNIELQEIPNARQFENMYEPPTYASLFPPDKHVQ